MAGKPVVAAAVPDRIRHLTLRQSFQNQVHRNDRVIPVSAKSGLVQHRTEPLKEPYITGYCWNRDRPVEIDPVGAEQVSLIGALVGAEDIFESASSPGGHGEARGSTGQ